MLTMHDCQYRAYRNKALECFSTELHTCIPGEGSVLESVHSLSNAYQYY